MKTIFVLIFSLLPGVTIAQTGWVVAKQTKGASRPVAQDASLSESATKQKISEEMTGVNKENRKMNDCSSLTGQEKSDCLDSKKVRK